MKPNFTAKQRAYIQHLHEQALHDYERVDYNQRYMAITEPEGEYLYNIAATNSCTTIVEFGSSHGISTIYLAMAAKEHNGIVIATENMAPKAEYLQNNIEQMQLKDYVDLRIGDAQETLKNIEGTIDMLFLDGQKNEYWEVLELLLPHLTPKSIIIADNTETRFSKSFMSRLKRDKRFTYEHIEWPRTRMTKIEYFNP
jgi:predicted O-methyltransferase YrrM